MRTTIAAGLAALIAASTAVPAAQAQPSDTLTRDIRCMLILAAAKPSPEQQAAFQLSTIYLFGRMDAQSGDADWVPRVMAEAKAMEGKDITADQKACSAFLLSKGNEMVERGQRLQRLGQEMSRPKP